MGGVGVGISSTYEPLRREKFPVDPEVVCKGKLFYGAGKYCFVVGEHTNRIIKSYGIIHLRKDF